MPETPDDELHRLIREFRDQQREEADTVKLLTDPKLRVQFVREKERTFTQRLRLARQTYEECREAWDRTLNEVEEALQDDEANIRDALDGYYRELAAMLRYMATIHQLLH